MGIVRFKNLSRFGQINEFVINPFPVNQDFEDDNVDRSFFVSSVDIASRIKSSSLIQGQYDTAEDLARGFAIDVFARQRGIDISEISQLKHEYESKVREDIEDLYSRIDELTSVKNVLNSGSVQLNSSSAE